MYIPESFKVEDQHVIEKFINKYPFAILTSVHQGKILATHLPITRLKDGKLYGHIAKANPQSNLTSDDEICVIFSGEHAYISPTYYVSSFVAPTWNYSAVHLYGTVDFIDDYEMTWKLIAEQTEIYEGQDGWKLPNDQELKELIEFLRFFEIKVIHVEAKFKFNQNKSSEDQFSVIDSLKKDDKEQVAKFMEEVIRSK